MPVAAWHQTCKDTGVERFFMGLLLVLFAASLVMFFLYVPQMTFLTVFLILTGLLLAFGFGIYFGARNSEHNTGNPSAH